MPETPLPCGRCEKCTSRRTSGWSYRLMKQYDTCHTAYFVTLTYDTDHVPITKKGYMSLAKRDVQLFMKRLRKSDKGKIRYYLCGEYGSIKNRPHYHAIMFDVSNIKNIENAWTLGQVHIGTVTKASVGYTLKYISKPTRIPMHSNDDRVKEFSLMSKRIGATYLTEAMQIWHKSDLLDRMYIPIEDGKKIAMPRYYKDKLYEIEERQAISEKQKIRVQEIEDEERLKYGDQYEKIKVERVQHSQQKMAKKAKQNQQL